MQNTRHGITGSPTGSEAADVALQEMGEADLREVVSEMAGLLRRVEMMPHDPLTPAVHKMAGQVAGCMACEARTLLARIEGE